MAGICINTSRLAPQAAADYLRDTQAALRLPCCDPVRTGVAAIVDGLLLTAEARSDAA